MSEKKHEIKNVKLAKILPIATLISLALSGVQGVALFLLVGWLSPIAMFLISFIVLPLIHLIFLIVDLSVVVATYNAIAKNKNIGGIRYKTKLLN